MAMVYFVLLSLPSVASLVMIYERTFTHSLIVYPFQQHTQIKPINDDTRCRNYKNYSNLLKNTQIYSNAYNKVISPLASFSNCSGCVLEFTNCLNTPFSLSNNSTGPPYSTTWPASITNTLSLSIIVSNR